MTEEVEHGTRDHYRAFEGHDHIHPVTRQEYIGKDGRAYDTEAKAHYAGAMSALQLFLANRAQANRGSTVHALAEALMQNADEVMRILSAPKNKHELESIAHKFCVDEGTAPVRTKANTRLKHQDDEPDEDAVEDVTEKTYDSDDIISAFRRGAEWGAKITPIKAPVEPRGYSDKA